MYLKFLDFVCNINDKGLIHQSGIEFIEDYPSFL